MNDKFIKHLEKCSDIVRTWPAWKQTLLGGKPMETEKISEPKIDKRVQKLVEVLNSLNATTTSSSCGGHKNPELGQRAEDEFYVDFTVSQIDDPFCDLQIIAEVITYYWQDKITCQICYNKDVMFIIEGRDGADPDKFAQDILDN